MCTIMKREINASFMVATFMLLLLVEHSSTVRLRNTISLILVLPLFLFQCMVYITIIVHSSHSVITIEGKNWVILHKTLLAYNVMYIQVCDHTTPLVQRGGCSSGYQVRCLWVDACLHVQ